MRYRRLTYRYQVVLATPELRPFGDPWSTGRSTVVLAQPRWRPSADVYETATAIIVTVELAGVEQEELEVLLFEDALVVEGLRPPPSCEEGCVYHSAEIRHGPFRLEVALPRPIDPDRVEARYERGLLQIALGKSKVE